MITTAPVTAVVATTDIGRAKEFYGGTLGLKTADAAMPEGPAVLYACGGDSTLLVYERATAGDSAATCASFQVGDVPATVERLRSSGVTFEEYDLGDTRTEDGVATMDGFQAAWFKDPDGNILCITG